MTRTEYLTQLELYLKKLPEADQIEAMDYFRELFDDAGVEGEEELIASLGTPKEAAHEVLSNLLDKKINEAPAQKNNRQILHIALLALLAAPIGIPLGIAILVSLFAIFVAALTVILAFFAVSILGIIGGSLFLVESFTVLAQAKSAFILIFWFWFTGYRCFFAGFTWYFLCSSLLRSTHCSPGAICSQKRKER